MDTYTNNMHPPPPPYYPQPIQVLMEAPQPKTQPIRDWLPWSIANIFIAWGLLAFVLLIFSLIC